MQCLFFSSSSRFNEALGWAPCAFDEEAAALVLRWVIEEVAKFWLRPCLRHILPLR